MYIYIYIDACIVQTYVLFLLNVDYVGFYATFSWFLCCMVLDDPSARSMTASGKHPGWVCLRIPKKYVPIQMEIRIYFWDMRICTIVVPMQTIEMLPNISCCKAPRIVKNPKKNLLTISTCKAKAQKPGSMVHSGVLTHMPNSTNGTERSNPF